MISAILSGFQIFFLAFAWALQPGVLATVTGLGAVNKLSTPNKTYTADYIEGENAYIIVEQKQANERHRDVSKLVHHDCIHGNRCLVFQGFEYPDCADCGSDRLELNLSRYSSRDAMTFDDWRYMRFYLRVHPSTAIPRRSIISQVWQGSSVAFGSRPALGPAFAIFLRQHSDPNYLYVDFTYRNEVSDSNLATTFHTDTIKKGQWYNYHVKMNARYPGHPRGRGVILIFKNKGICGNLNTADAINYSASNMSKYKFYWGYKPDPATRLGNTFDIRVGIYRPAPFKYFTFWMDTIKLTNTAAAMCGE